MKTQKMRHSVIWLGLSCVLALSWGCQTAHITGTGQQSQGSLTVVPDHEKKIARYKKLSGPTKTHGIAAIKTLVALHLGSEFAGLAGQQMRARILIIKPGAVVAVHQHERRPGFALILEGEMVEHRNDHKGPIIRRVGDVAVERTGVSHWWENRSGKVARALVVDIVPTPKLTRQHH
jgi:quercetin dioxygenase-like cupin family protein